MYLINKFTEIEQLGGKTIASDYWRMMIAGEIGSLSDYKKLQAFASARGLSMPPMPLWLVEPEESAKETINEEEVRVRRKKRKPRPDLLPQI
jgi:hypothetical protein